MTRAVELLTSAAEREFATAQYALAKLYLADELVSKDIEKALYWLHRAVAQGDQYAQYQLGKMYLFGLDVQRDEKLGKELLRASAAQGNVYAQRILDSYGRQPIGMACLRLLSNIAQIFQENIEKEQKNVNQIDRKLRRKIAEKKQAHGQRMG